jgi:thiol-disulfide isomerase/thioredoxin
LIAACSSRPVAPELEGGEWRAWLDSPGGPLPFGLTLETDSDGVLSATLINGKERIPVPRARLRDGRLSLLIDHYDSSVEASVSDAGRRLDGEWQRTAGPDSKSRLPFHAVAGAAPRFDAEPAATKGPAVVAGRWAVDFETEEEIAVAILEPTLDGALAGTFLLSTGDYRFLAGSFEGDRLRLSTFDGAHAFLFDARLLPDGNLAGDFWSRDSWHETWTAVRDPEVELPDAFELTAWNEGADLADVAFLDTHGNLRSLADPDLLGEATIIELFGSWCPNCNDAADYLVELDRRYRGRGLSIVGLAFEMTGDFDRDAAQVRTFAEHHGIQFPLLVAGLADKDAASGAFPLIDRVRSYPTTIFVDRTGRLRAVHSGYSGPATGDAERTMKARLEALIEELLGEADAAAGAVAGD